MHPHSPSSPSTPDSGGSVRRLLAPILLLAAVALPSAVLYHAAAPATTSPFRARPWNVTASAVAAVADNVAADLADQEPEEVRLKRVLNAAAKEDKTVILTTLNAAWAHPNSVIDLFIQSFRIGNGTRRLLDHLVIIALDQKAYVRCISLHEHCFALTTKGVDFSGEKRFMSNDYLEMMWRRIDLLRLVLEMGYNFIFTDTDIMWFRNPLPHFYPDGDFQIACDHFLGNATSLENTANGGFTYVRSNHQTIEFYKFWYASREEYPGHHDQNVFNAIKYDPFISEIGLQIRFLSTTYFGGICEPSKDLNKVCTMHTNCCIGLQSKLIDLGVMLEDWRRFMSLPPILKESHVLSWRIPKNCSLHHD